MKYNVLESIKLKTSKGRHELLPGQVATLSDQVATRLIGEGRIRPYETKGSTYAFEETQVFTGVLAEGREKLLKPISDDALLDVYQKVMDKINASCITDTTPNIQEHNKQLDTEINNADDRVNNVWRRCNKGEAILNTYQALYSKTIDIKRESIASTVEKLCACGSHAIPYLDSSGK
jgi:hypothetical protein